MTSKKSDVVDLTKRLRLSRKQLLEQLFEEHAVALRNFAKGHMASLEEVDDIVQEVFSRLMKLDNLEGKMSARSGSNRSFLLAMANSIIIDRERHKRICRNYSITQSQFERDKSYDVSPERSAIASRDLDIIKQTIMEMRPTWRNAFILNRFKYLSYREVAESMGVSLKQVEHFMAKAIERIREAERLIKPQGDRS